MTFRRRVRKALLHAGFRFARRIHGLGFRDHPVYRRLVDWANRFLFSHSSKLGDRTIEVTIEDLDLVFPRDSAFVYVHRNFEPATRRLLARILDPGQIVADIGANAGLMTLTMARHVSSNGRVYAVEPAPDNLTFLHHNLVLNAFDNVVVLPVAAGARNERRPLLLRRSGTLHGFVASATERTLHELLVPVRRLDDLLEGPVHLIKIDTEGTELEVLEGMERILKENSSLRLIVEWNHLTLRNAGRDIEELPSRLAQLGFRCRVIREDDATFCSVASICDAERRGALQERWFGNIFAERLPTT